MRVPLITSPVIPRTMVDTVQALISATKGVQENLCQYLVTGDIDFLHHTINHMMLISSMKTKQCLRKLIADGVLGGHPMTDGERQQAVERLNPCNRN